MYQAPLLFFLATLLPAGLLLAFPAFFAKYLDCTLTFGGSYLFALTLLHILPEIFEHAAPNPPVGYYLLLGFVLQLMLDAFGGSLAHGHSYPHESKRPLQTPIVTLLGALFLHAFLDGALLHEDNFSIWFAIWLHKVPVLFTLGSFLHHRKISLQVIWIIFLLFALTTPLSFLIRENLQHYQLVTSQTITALNAVATGGLFHITTVILFESNPHHHYNSKRWYTILGGIGVAILSNYFIAHK